MRAVHDMRASQVKRNELEPLVKQHGFKRKTSVVEAMAGVMNVHGSRLRVNGVDECYYGMTLLAM